MSKTQNVKHTLLNKLGDDQNLKQAVHSIFYDGLLEDKALALFCHWCQCCETVLVSIQLYESCLYEDPQEHGCPPTLILRKHHLLSERGMNETPLTLWQLTW
jgi:hypothetical protein